MIENASRSSLSENDIVVRPSFQEKRISTLIRGAVALVAMGSRLIICPGDDVLAVVASTSMGITNSDTPREAVLPDPIKIIYEDEREDVRKGSRL